MKMWNNQFYTKDDHFQCPSESMQLLERRCLRCSKLFAIFAAMFQPKSLKFLLTTVHFSGFKNSKKLEQVARCIEWLAEYNFNIVYRLGLQHSTAGALSRYFHTVFAISATKDHLSTQLKNKYCKKQANDFITSSLLLKIKQAVRPDVNYLEGANQL